MAKIRSTIGPLSGKLGNEVHVNSHAYKPYVRKPAKKVARKKDDAFSEQNGRTATLNQLAGDINSIVLGYTGSFKSKPFYRTMLKRLRREPLDERCLLLLQLKGMEVNDDYPTSRMGIAETGVSTVKNKILVTVDVKTHPQSRRGSADCYFYDLILFTWTKTGERARHARQISDWIDMSKGKPVFQFEFPKPSAATTWMLCLGQQLGKNKRTLTTYDSRAMRIVDVGSFDEGEKRLMEEKLNVAKEKVPPRKDIYEGVVRVKAIRIRK